jgi:tetratricopeptide (TPR) repeat protein
MKRANWEKDANARQAIYLLGQVLEREGKLADAEALYRQTFASLKQALSINERDMANILSDLERVLLLEGKLDEARSLVEAYLDEARLKLAPGDPVWVNILNDLVWNFFLAGHSDEALPLADELLKAVRAQPISNGPDQLPAIDTVASIDEATGRLDQAVALFEEVVAGRKAASGPNDPNTLAEMQKLGQAYQKAVRLADSQRVLEETVNLYKTNHIFETPDAAIALARLGLTLIREGKFEEAESQVRQATAIFTKFPISFWPSYSQSILGEALAGQKKYGDAEPLLLQGYRGMKEMENQIAGNRAQLLMDAAQQLVGLYTAWGNADSAAQWSAVIDGMNRDLPATTRAAGGVP